MIRRGIFVSVEDGRYYLDQAAYEAYLLRRRRLVMNLLLFLGGFALLYWLSALFSFFSR